jgi:hypothetical protein
MIRNSTHFNNLEIFFDRKPQLPFPEVQRSAAGGAANRHHAAAPRGANSVADQSFAIVDIPDVHLLVFEYSPIY